MHQHLEAINKRAEWLKRNACFQHDWVLHTDYHSIHYIQGEIYHFSKGLCMTRNRKGYLVIQIDGRQVPAHKFMFEQFWGFSPGIGEQIDHIDRDIRNNSIFNLRCVSLDQQAQNKGLRKDNRYGCPGIYVVGRKKNRYRAEIQANGIIYRLGTFTSLEEAIEARNAKAAELNKEINTCFNLFPVETKSSNEQYQSGKQLQSLFDQKLLMDSGSSSKIASPIMDIDLTLDSTCSSNDTIDLTSDNSLNLNIEHQVSLDNQSPTRKRNIELAYEDESKYKACSLSLQELKDWFESFSETMCDSPVKKKTRKE